MTEKQDQAAARHSLLGRWQGMLLRCFDPQSTGYYRYGGRGITVDKAFLNFDTYVEHLCSLPNALQPGYSIDRIDNDGNYAPGNLRWATSEMQIKNRGKFVSAAPGAPLRGDTTITPTANWRAVWLQLEQQWTCKIGELDFLGWVASAVTQRPAGSPLPNFALPIDPARPLTCDNLRLVALVGKPVSPFLELDGITYDVRSFTAHRLLGRVPARAVLKLLGNGYSEAAIVRFVEDCHQLVIPPVPRDVPVGVGFTNLVGHFTPLEGTAKGTKVTCRCRRCGSKMTQPLCIFSLGSDRGARLRNCVTCFNAWQKTHIDPVVKKEFL